MIFRHYKGGKYRVLFHASESTNARAKPDRPADLVVYVSLTTGKIHVREREEFYGLVVIRGSDGLVLNTCLRFTEVEPT
jgi:hypothetical protein